MNTLAVGWLFVATAASPGWIQDLDALQLGAAVPASVLRGGVEIRSEEPQGPARALLRTGLLADLNRHGASPRGPAGLDLSRFARVHVGERQGVRWIVAADRSGRLTAARFEVPVPVDARRDGRFPGSAPDRLQPLRSALAALGPRPLSVRERDHRGNPFAWRAPARGGTLWVRHRPEQDLLSVLLARR